MLTDIEEVRDTGAAASTDTDQVDELVQKLQENRQAPSDAFLSISVVSAHSRALGDMRYTPCHVSMGPFHRRRSAKLCRDAEKLSCLEYLLQKQIEPRRVKLKVDKVKEALERHKILECYGLKAEEREDLVDMLLLDACYLVTVIGKGPVSGAASQSQAPPAITEDRPPSLFNDTDWALMMRDTWYLLENQIPFIVVKEIYFCSYNVASRQAADDVFTRYARELLRDDCYIARNTEEEQNNGGNNPGNSNPIYHLLHLLYTCFPKPLAQEFADATDAKVGPWRRATEYVGYCNVRFVRRKLGGTNARSVLDVTIDGGKVLVPRLLINGNTWTILLNLMALEQQHPSVGSHVTAYCLFMSQVACTVEDVKHLLRADVIENHLGDPGKVAAGFAELCSGVIFDSDKVSKNYLKPLWLHLEKRYRSRAHNFLSWFRLRYWSCRNLPVLIAAIVAFLVLLCGAVSAVYAVLTYYHPATPARAHN